ncbi:Carboxylesterase family protein [Metarhizium acridum CQMa 102]|uniref:Carboxylesterase family protein n=1 Tax=Metarhizium acridum (strain CQMa 102) TaxID=655827 RepID=E9E0J9_METAQ|nr:Carboxylesterase family protein [Metarhizium acridum CQMa 102]EFY90619.1 Carboxylesterase family protein [Metarhizium acridum CQMa 102]
MANVSKITLQLPNGKITVLQNDNILIARGIPYSQAERFQPPQPMPNGSSTKDFTQSCPICPQLKSRLDALNGPIAQGRAMSEDCFRAGVESVAICAGNGIHPRRRVFLRRRPRGERCCGGEYHESPRDLGLPTHRGKSARQPGADGSDCRFEMGSGEYRILRRRPEESLCIWGVSRRGFYILSDGGEWDRGVVPKGHYAERALGANMGPAGDFGCFGETGFRTGARGSRRCLWGGIADDPRQAGDEGVVVCYGWLAVRPADGPRSAARYRDI